MQDTTKLFMVEMGNIHVFTLAYDREGAKRNAHDWIGGDSDTYIVSPLTEVGDRIHFSLTVRV